MNRMGSTASGGIIATVFSSGENNARARGITPMHTARSTANGALIASAAPMRFRLAQVSAQNST